MVECSLLRRLFLFPHRLQIRPRKAPRVLRDLFRCAFGHDFAALDAAFGAHVDDPVGGLDDVEIMFDHDDADALLHKGVEDFQQFADILEMEAGGGLVQYVERVAGRSEEHTSELQSLMRISYAVFCLKKKKNSDR